MIVTHEDEVRADRSYRTGVLRITIACTGVAAAHFSLCLHVKSRHLGDAYRYPTESRVGMDTNIRNCPSCDTPTDGSASYCTACGFGNNGNDRPRILFALAAAALLAVMLLAVALLLVAFIWRGLRGMG
ncbi:hypothetical protein LF1_52340 [Rubripirellula obstinata]|uniref:Uncharacterized protein n=1 Tax=Rubripirellula obstinata TaxID=406547 RepID=A0A5B1CBL7_9BACT|nr:hypothetical protein [Rubripirellula obstinata]KAA1257385.1 hypothetical protein LF1_52340 [Rubripirellula obstinata]